jgi:hypothetical protein
VVRACVGGWQVAGERGGGVWVGGRVGDHPMVDRAEGKGAWNSFTGRASFSMLAQSWAPWVSELHMAARDGGGRGDSASHQHVGLTAHVPSQGGQGSHQVALGANRGVRRSKQLVHKLHHGRGGVLAGVLNPGAKVVQHQGWQGGHLVLGNQGLLTLRVHAPKQNLTGDRQQRGGWERGRCERRPSPSSRVMDG